MTTKRKRRGRRGWEPPLFEWSQLGPVPVHLVDPDDPILENAKDWGRCDLNERVIYLDNSLSEKMMRVTLTHEWLHFAALDSGLLNGTDEEKGIQGLATAIIAREDFHAAGGVPEAPTGRARGRAQ
jgi:hypothetical protein